MILIKIWFKMANRVIRLKLCFCKKCSLSASFDQLVHCFAFISKTKSLRMSRDNSTLFIVHTS